MGDCQAEQKNGGNGGAIVKQILFNLALFGLTNFCSENGVDCSGSRAVYNGRFKYSLVTVAGGKLLASVQFYKNRVPEYSRPFVA